MRESALGPGPAVARAADQVGIYLLEAVAVAVEGWSSSAAITQFRQLVEVMCGQREAAMIHVHRGRSLAAMCVARASWMSQLDLESFSHQSPAV